MHHEFPAMMGKLAERDAKAKKEKGYRALNKNERERKSISDQPVFQMKIL